LAETPEVKKVKVVIKTEHNSQKKHLHNKGIRSALKTDVTHAEKLIFAGQPEEAKKAVAAAISSLDKAAEKKIIHPNNAARRKSRLVKKLNGIPGATKTAPEKAK
jgi:small subunit ribosomal protein S20